MAEAFSTYAAVLDLVRESLNEETESEWDDDTQLIPYLSQSERWFAALLGRLKGNGRYVYEEDITLAADAETIAMSTLTKTLSSIDYVHFKNTANNWTSCSEIIIGDESRLRGGSAFTVSGDVAPAYQMRRPNLFFLPKSTSARTLKIRYRWIPAAKVAGATMETPSQYDDLLVARVLFYALGDEGERDGSFEDRYSGRISEIESFETGAQNTGRGERVTNRTTRHQYPF